MKGFMHIEFTDREGALSCHADISEISQLEKMQVLDAACRLLQMSTHELAVFFAVRASGAFEHCIIQTGEADISLGDTAELIRQYQEMKKEDNENGNGEKM